ncbi:hypothetical protein S1OALGB6SA_1314 [Olavius algarvensis spirochete endosymbiont]|nr:hypothetical protein S1OALGB6SA_1314 [Olavius algarvensis spirochete endosymbiont]
MTLSGGKGNILDTVNAIQTVEEFRTLANGAKPFCAIFTADWCVDCKVLKPMLPDIEKEFDNLYMFATVDWDAFKNLSEEYSILGVPSFVSFHKGEVIGTLISGQRKTRQQIRNYLYSHQIHHNS